MPSDDVHRLHPLSLLFRLGATLRGLFIPALLVVFASGDEDRLLWLVPFVAVSAIHSVFHYVTCRYRFAGDELVVRGGVFFRYERHVPYERVQNIDVSQGLLQRLFSVADVRIETASGAEAEAHLQVLSLGAVEQMRARVFAGRIAGGVLDATGEPAGPDGEAPSSPQPLLPAGAGARDDDLARVPLGAPDAAAAAAPEPDRTLLRLTAGDLVLFGIVSNRGMAVVLALIGAAWELELLPEVGEEDMERLAGSFGPLVLGLVAVAAILGLRLLSIVWAFVKLHGFELHRRGEDLQTRCGLLTRLTATLPRHRVQVVTVTETILHRLFDRVAVKVDTAGGSSLEQSAATRRWVAPLIRRSELPALLDEIQPGSDLEHVNWQPADTRAFRRMLRRNLIVFVLVLAGACLWWGPMALLAAIPLVPLFVWDSHRRAAGLGFCLTERGVGIRSGAWTRTRRVALYPKLQVVSRVESPFDRRWGMGAVAVDTAGGAPLPLGVEYLPADVADGLHAHLADRAAESEFRW